MRRRKWFALLLCLTLAAALLAGCGGEAREQKSEEKKETVAEEPKVNAEDFYGCWEYASMDCWMYIYSDGSFEWFYEDGSSVTGEYAMDGEKLCLTDYDLSFTLDGEGGLVDSDGDVLFQSALPDFVDPPYFEANGIMINYLLGQGDVSVPDAASYFEANTEGQYYNTAPLVCAISMDGEEHLGNGYIRRYYTLYRGFQDSEVPMFGNGVMLGSGYFFYDYYSGLHLPDNEYFKMGEGSDFYFEFESSDGWVDLQISSSTTSNDEIEGYQRMYTTSLTVVAPDWYDGLVLSVPTRPGDYQSMMDYSTVMTGLTDLVPALDLPFDPSTGLNCKLL